MNSTHPKKKGSSYKNEEVIDIFHKQYDHETLKMNIYSLNLWDILHYQKIDAVFAVRYILNRRYQMSESEHFITKEDVLFLQPHIFKEELEKELKRYLPSHDSFPAFDTMSE